MSRLEIKIKPMGYRRMTRKSMWAHGDYHEYMEKIRATAEVEEFEPSGALCLDFYMPMPKSWSKKKKKEMLDRPHESKPDLDNLVKAVLDALFYRKGGDSSVWLIDAMKRYSDEGKIVIRNI